MGMGPNQPSVVSQYAVNYGAHKPSAGASSHNASFSSPTESEFSEPSDGQDSIRWVALPTQPINDDKDLC